VPALAVADELRDRGAEVAFLGAAGRVEAELVPAAGYEIDLLHLEGIDRSSRARAARAATLAAAAVSPARRALRRRRAAAVIGGGGYVAGPVGVAAVSLHLPLVLTEADRHLGLANRLLARRARRVCLAFPIAGLVGDRYLVTGRPVPAAVGHADRASARRRFGIDGGDHCLLVFGGSQGARSINECALDAFAGPRAPGDAEPRAFHVLHITGHRDYPAARERIERLRPDRYTLLEYEPTLAEPLAAADLVLARAGGSVFELAAAGRPAILVPYPHAAGRHQEANAEWMAAAGAAEVIPDPELTPARAAALAAAILADDDRLERMAAASRSLARPDAAARVADEVLAAVRAGGR